MLCVVYGSRSFVRPKYLRKVGNISSSQDVVYHGNIIVVVVIVVVVVVVIVVDDDDNLITLLSICLLENVHLSQIGDGIRLKWGKKINPIP